MTLSPRLVLWLVLPPLLWAGNAVVGRLVAPLAPPVLLNALRWTLALVLLLLLAPSARQVLRQPGQLRARWRQWAVLGILGIGCYNALQYRALHTSSALNVTLIYASLPLWMMGLGGALFGVRPTRRQGLGALLSLLGVAVVLAGGDITRLRQVQFVPGDLLMLLAVVLWALYSWVLVRPPACLTRGGPPLTDWATLLTAQLLFGLLFSWATAGVEQWFSPPPTQWSWALGAALLYVAIGPSLLAYRCWGLGVAQGGPTLAAFFSNLTPLFAAVLGTLFAGDTPQPYHALAFLLIAAGIVVANTARARAAKR